MSEGVFNNYEIVRRISTGGMGEILLARQRGVAGTARNVIIKMILPHLAQDPEFISRFTDETRIAASLSHGNIVQIFESGCWEGRFYMVMEHVDGMDLKELLRVSGQFRNRDGWVPFCIHVLSETAKALAYAHEKRDHDGRPLGIVHRDVSPSNILISREGLVKLTDFGVAKAAQRSSVTMPGKLHGKVNYMAPEQVRGLECDHRSDIFSLGVTGYEMLAGRRPFEGDSDVAVLEKIRKMTFVPLEEASPATPPELSAIVSRAMAADPDARWQSAEEFSAALLAFAHDRGMTVMSRDVATMLNPAFQEGPPAAGCGVSPDQYLDDAVAELLRTPSSGSRVSTGDVIQLPAQRERTVTISEPVPETSAAGSRGRGLKFVLIPIVVLLGATGGLALYRVFDARTTPEDPAVVAARPPDGRRAASLAGDISKPLFAPGMPIPADGKVQADGKTTTDGPAPADSQASVGRQVPADRQASGEGAAISPETASGILPTQPLATAPGTAAQNRAAAQQPVRQDARKVVKGGPDPSTVNPPVSTDGRVIFRFFPADSAVLIDGAAITPDGNLVELDLPAGNHTLTISANKGANKKTRSFTIDAGKSLALGTIEVEREPAR